ncbi:MAG: hypothetical protein ACLU0O_01875 [Collinsella sp.]
MTAGIQSVICSGEEPDALVRLARGERGHLFDPPRSAWTCAAQAVDRAG